MGKKPTVAEGKSQVQKLQADEVCQTQAQTLHNAAGEHIQLIREKELIIRHGLS